jgi:F-type H+-transporting ATPase subunit b
MNILLTLDGLHGSRILAAGLIDLDATFVVQLVLFLVLIIALKILLFDPYLALSDKREEATDGARRLAEKAQADAEVAGAEIEKRLSATRAEGVRLRNELRTEGERAGKVETDKTRSQLEKVTDRRLTELAGAEAGARVALPTEARRLAEQMAQRILGEQR